MLLAPPTSPSPRKRTDCKAALSDSDLEQLSIYDKDIYVDSDCVDSETPLPVHCNYMGLGQECRGCFKTCDGALRYMDDYAAEIAEWVSYIAQALGCPRRKRDRARCTKTAMVSSGASPSHIPSVEEE